MLIGSGWHAASATCRRARNCQAPDLYWRTAHSRRRCINRTVRSYPRGAAGKRFSAKSTFLSTVFFWKNRSFNRYITAVWIYFPPLLLHFSPLFFNSPVNCQKDGSNNIDTPAFLAALEMAVQIGSKGPVVSRNHELCSKNEELCSKNEELCIQNEELCIQNEWFFRQCERRSSLWTVVFITNRIPDWILHW